MTQPLRDAALIALALVAALAQSAPLGWVLGELSASLGLHLGLALAALGALYAVAGRWSRAGAATAAAGLALWPFALGFAEPRAEPLPEARTSSLRILVSNPQYENPEVAELAAAIAATDASLLALIEPPRDLADVLAGDGSWRVLAAHQPGTKFNIALLARSRDTSIALEGSRQVFSDHGASVILDVSLRFRGKPLRVLVTHPEAPLRKRSKRHRDDVIEKLARIAQASAVPVLILGDLNCTVASPMWRRLARTGLLRPPGWSPATFPRVAGPFGMAIDHVLLDPSLAATPAEPLGLPGADHRALRVDVGWASL